MNYTRLLLLIPLTAVLAACGKDGGGKAVATVNGDVITERDVDSQVPLSVERTYEATRQAFRELGITEGKYSTEHDDGRENQPVSGDDGLDRGGETEECAGDEKAPQWHRAVARK